MNNVLYDNATQPSGGQDKYISSFIFNEKRNGYFVEVGAADGARNAYKSC